MGLSREIARLFGYDLMRYKKSFRFEATLDRLLKRHTFSCVLDIGANNGWFSGHCIKSLGAVPVYSFEPAGELAQALRQKAKDNPNWHIVQAALGDQAGEASLNLSGGSGVFNSLNAANPDFIDRFSELKFVGSETVTITTLDRFAEENDLSNHDQMLVKIDTQGHDFKVLKGGAKTLSTAKAVIIELPFQNIYDTTESYRDILDFMDEAGFDIYSLAPISPDQDGALIEADGFFLRRGQRREVS